MKTKKLEMMILGKLSIQITDGKSVPGRSISIQLYSSTQIDPSTRKGKLSKKSNLKQEKITTDKINGIKTTSYRFGVAVELDFGLPGAFIIKNQQKHEFYLQSLVLQAQNNRLIHFECNSWIYPSSVTRVNRVFFSNICYLPNQTPNGLLELRKEELISLRGDGTGRMNKWDRIYDYDKYDDLGDPDKGPEYLRPVLGGSNAYPYPRRLKTSHGHSINGMEETNQKEVFNIEIIVPPDERFSPKKQAELTKNCIQAALHFVVSQGKSEYRDLRHFHSFSEMYGLYRRYKSHRLEEWAIKKLRNLLPVELFKKIKRDIKEYTVRFPLPQIIRGNEFAWKEDEEFARQMLAGTNATVIQCLKKFPPESKKGVISSIKVSHIEHNLDGLTLQEAMHQWRIFILDHHDYLMPFLERVCVDGRCAYASRTLLFLKDDSTLKPLAIELSFPDSSSESEGQITEIQRIFYPKTEGSEAALWQLAKAHVAVNDSGYHQLFNHWLKTHVVVEPFIVATRRRLSRMHPVHRLLEPHFKDTMHINALYRKVLMSVGGILEKTIFTGEVSVEISSALYKDWRFDEQSVPVDLIKRGMAIYNPEHPAGVELVFKDYPYGADGLEIWVAIKNWVVDCCSHFYHDDESLKSDKEIQEWWSEIRNVGHGDKSKETWWFTMTTLSELTEALATLIWISSGFHASLNFGYYGYNGYPPNRPTKCRRFIPIEGTREFGEFLEDPDRYFLAMLPNRYEITLHMAMAEVLSRHASDEVYLGQQKSPNYWMDDEWTQHRFRRFIKELTEVEKRIQERNADHKLMNRWGPAKIPYTLLYPDVSNGGHGRSISGRGIPNSISI